MLECLHSLRIPRGPIGYLFGNHNLPSKCYLTVEVATEDGQVGMGEEFLNHGRPPLKELVRPLQPPHLKA